jgi:hypothetical protein
MTEMEPIDECKLLLEQAAQLGIQVAPIPELDTINTELIINNNLISIHTC